MDLIRFVHMLVKSVLVLLVLCSRCEARDSDLNYVTCGSLVKLLNTRHNVRLHSHDVKYGSGNLHPSSNIHAAFHPPSRTWAPRWIFFASLNMIP